MRCLSKRFAGMAALAGIVSCAVAAGGVGSQSNHHVAPVKPAQAAIKTVANFDETTWGHLLAHGPRPAAYVFTTSYCSTCPQAFAAVHHAIRAKGKPVELGAVLMDVPPERVLAHAHHYVGVSSYYAFDGFAPAIRQSVDPSWPNVTPYVVLVDGKGTVVHRGIGIPPARALARWK